MSMMNRKEKIEKLYASSAPGLYKKFIDILENLEYEQKPWEAGNLWITRSKVIHLKQYPFDYKDFADMKTAVCYCRKGKWNVESKGIPDKIYSSPQELLLDWTID